VSASTDRVRALPADAITWTLAPAQEPRTSGELVDQLVDAVIAARSYRALAQKGLHLISELTIANDRLHEDKQRAEDEARQLRAFLLVKDGATP
jgi:hypothetical protein